MSEDLSDERGNGRRRRRGRRKATPPGEGATQRARQLLQEMLDLMDVSATAEAEMQGDQIRLDIVGEEASQLVGKKGAVLDAIQLIVAKILNRTDGPGLAVNVDADGYRDRREDSLVKLAHRLKDEAIESGRVVALNPMSARDRRIIHMTLREIPGVSTRSEGEGLDRRLLIVPE